MDENTTQIEVAEGGSLYSHPLAKAFLSKVYAWMAVSMLVTAGVAVYSTHNNTLMDWTGDHLMLIALSTLGIILVMCFCRGILTSTMLGVLLLVFSAAEGLLFGPILQHYTQQSLGLTFACTASTFGVMALFGALTKRNLGAWGRGLCMCLFGLIICLVINLFWGNGTFDLIISGIGVILFSLLTAYDTQKILSNGLSLSGEERAKGAIFGALDLYLDFLNLFLYLLRFLGERK